LLLASVWWFLSLECAGGSVLELKPPFAFAVSDGAVAIPWLSAVFSAGLRLLFAIGRWNWLKPPFAFTVSDGAVAIRWLSAAFSAGLRFLFAIGRWNWFPAPSEDDIMVYSVLYTAANLINYLVKVQEAQAIWLF
jgi:hypothetical protein